MKKINNSNNSIPAGSFAVHIWDDHLRCSWRIISGLGIICPPKWANFTTSENS